MNKLKSLPDMGKALKALTYCPDCKGIGINPIAYSCCGDDITGNDIDLCPSCFEHCSTEPEDECEECNGTGKKQTP